MGLLDMDIFTELRRMNKRQVMIFSWPFFKQIYQLLTIFIVVSSALMFWKAFILYSYADSPLVVVLRFVCLFSIIFSSGSMEPAFYRGDVLYLTNYPDDPIKVGDIIVFKIEGRDIPIVHRVLEYHENANGSIKILTKGDNNPVHDRGLYAPGDDWLVPEQIIGRVKGFIPHVGQLTIVMNDNPKLKYTVLGAMGLYLLLNRDN